MRVRIGFKSSVDPRPQQPGQPVFLESSGSGTTGGNVAEEITRYRDLRFEFDTTLWKLQLIDFAGLTSLLAPWNRKCIQTE